MVSEFKELLDRLDPTQERIHSTSFWCQEFLYTHPNHMQTIVDLWSKAIETSNQKIALIFLANDIIQNARNETLKAMFQFSLPRAITVSATNPGSIQDIRKVLKVWDDRQVFPRHIIEEWEKICERAESQGPKSDRSHLAYVISLAKKMKKLKQAGLAVERCQGEDIRRVAYAEQKAREEVIKEIVSAMKKVYHGDLNVSIHLHKINEKLNKIEEIES